MADGMHFDTLQLAALAARLDSGAARVGARGAQVLRKTALDIVRDAQALAPVDTGNLKSSIGAEFTGDGRTTTMEATIGPTANYGHYLEAGTSRMAPRPYMGPATERRVPGFIQAVTQLGGEILG